GRSVFRRGRRGIRRARGRSGRVRGGSIFRRRDRARRGRAARRAAWRADHKGRPACRVPWAANAVRGRQELPGLFLRRACADQPWRRARGNYYRRVWLNIGNEIPNVRKLAEPRPCGLLKTIRQNGTGSRLELPSSYYGQYDSARNIRKERTSEFRTCVAEQP